MRLEVAAGLQGQQVKWKRVMILRAFDVMRCVVILRYSFGANRTSSPAEANRLPSAGDSGMHEPTQQRHAHKECEDRASGDQGSGTTLCGGTPITSENPGTGVEGHESEEGAQAATRDD